MNNRLMLPVLMLPVLMLVVLAACGDPAPRASSGGSAAKTDPPLADSSGHYQANATVLETRERGPELCLGGIAESYPPQCSGLPITNWNWDEVDGEQRASGTTWGEYHVTGTFDGSRFTVTAVSGRQPPADGPGLARGCPDPPGGWPVPDPKRAGHLDIEKAGPSIEKMDDFAGLWISYPDGPPAEESYEGVAILLNVAFTRDIERHEADVRELWGGPLCMVRFQRTHAELERIQREFSGEEFGLTELHSSIDVTRNRVDVGVVVAGEDSVRAVEQRYGRGTVRLWPRLEPVPAED